MIGTRCLKGVGQQEKTQKGRKTAEKKLSAELLAEKKEEKLSENAGPARGESLKAPTEKRMAGRATDRARFKRRTGCSRAAFNA